MTEQPAPSSLERHPHYSVVALLVDTLLTQNPEAALVDRRAVVAECLDWMESMDSAGASLDTRIATLGRLVGMRFGEVMTARHLAHQTIEGMRKRRDT